MRSSKALPVAGRVFPSRDTLLLAKEKIDFKEPPNEDCGRNCRPLRSLVPSGSEINIPGIEDDAIVLFHDHKYVSEEEVPDDNDIFRSVDEKIDNELKRKELKRRSMLHYSSEEELLLKMGKSLDNLSNEKGALSGVDELEETIGNVPRTIASMRKFPAHRKKMFQLR